MDEVHHLKVIATGNIRIKSQVQSQLDVYIAFPFFGLAVLFCFVFLKEKQLNL